MSFIKCPECGNEISEKAVICIFCGCQINSIDAAITDKGPMNRKSDKKHSAESVLLRILARGWIVVLCMMIAFAGVYLYVANKPVEKKPVVTVYETEQEEQGETYTATAMIYWLTGNPNLVNYQYMNNNSADNADFAQTLKTIEKLTKSERVLDSVLVRLASYYSSSYELLKNESKASTEYLSSVLYIGNVNETSLIEIKATTENPQLSADICNAVAEVAPEKIKEVMIYGEMTMAQTAIAPEEPDEKKPVLVQESEYKPELSREEINHNAMNSGLIAALIAGAVSAVVLLILYFIKRRRYY